MKFKIKYATVLIVLTIGLSLFSCGGEHSHKGHNHGEKSDDNSDDDTHKEHEEEGLHLTKEQIATIGLEFGELSSIKVNDFVQATGTLGLPPNAYSSVSVKGTGIIRGNKKYVEGNYIKKGELIAYIENPEFIIKQQEYLEAKASFKLKKLDLKRQQSLIDANAGVNRELQKAQAEVSILEAKTAGLSKQLSYLGISTYNLTPKNIREKIAIIAPMSGFIANINLHNGMYAQPMISLMEIIATEHLHLELDVFEKDIAAIKIGQKISYSIPALENKMYQGKVNVIGKVFNSKSKTIRIHGHLEGDKPIFIKDLFINSKIWLNDNATNAVPEGAVISDGTNSFIYIAKNNKKANETEFNKINVIPGAVNKGFIAIKLLDEVPKGMQIVTKGAYYVYAQSKAGELEHEH